MQIVLSLYPFGQLNGNLEDGGREVQPQVQVTLLLYLETGNKILISDVVES